MNVVTEKRFTIIATVLGVKLVGTTVMPRSRKATTTISVTTISVIVGSLYPNEELGVRGVDGPHVWCFLCL